MPTDGDVMSAMMFWSTNTITIIQSEKLMDCGNVQHFLHKINGKFGIFPLSLHVQPENAIYIRKKT